MLKRCQFCDKPAGFECDYILGWNRNRMFHRCDAALCDGCRTQVGIITLNGVDSIDRCELHVGKADAATTVLMTAREAEAIRRRNRFVLVKAET